MCRLVSRVVILAIKRMEAGRAHLAAQIQTHEPSLEARVCIEEDLPFPTPKSHTLRHLGLRLSTAVPRALQTSNRVGGRLESENAHLDSNIDLRPLSVHSSVMLDDSWYSVKVIIMVVDQVTNG